MRKDARQQQRGSRVLHEQMHAAETAFSGSSLKHGALRSATTGSPVMERWVHENGVHEHISIPNTGSHRKSASSYVTYHHKTQASPTQRGVRPALKMARGGVDLSTETLLHGHRSRAEEAGAGSPQSRGSRSRRYQPGQQSLATSPASLRSTNQARSQHTANGGASVSAPTSSTTSSPSHLEGSSSSTQVSPKRRQTTLAEFGRTLMASKRVPNADGALVARTPKSSPRFRSGAAGAGGEDSAADLAAAAMANTSPANCADGSSVSNVLQETPRSGAALGDAPLGTRNGVGRRRSGGSHYSAHSLHSDSGSPRSGSGSPTSARSSIRHRNSDGGAGSNSSTGAASSIAQTTGEAFGEDMAIKIVQHHKDVTPTAKLGAGLKRIEGTGRTPLVLVAFGALNPVHLNHLRMFQTARAYIEAHTDFGVIGGYVIIGRALGYSILCAKLSALWLGSLRFALDCN